MVNAHDFQFVYMWVLMIVFTYVKPFGDAPLEVLAQISLRKNLDLDILKGFCGFVCSQRATK